MLMKGSGLSLVKFRFGPPPPSIMLATLDCCVQITLAGRIRRDCQPSRCAVSSKPGATGFALPRNRRSCPHECWNPDRSQIRRAARVADSGGRGRAADARSSRDRAGGRRRRQRICRSRLSQGGRIDRNRCARRVAGRRHDPQGQGAAAAGISADASGVDSFYLSSSGRRPPSFARVDSPPRDRRRLRNDPARRSRACRCSRR